ncbi:KAT8 regulatory NSL complex subunit 1 isoform X2 [Xenopus laevis]|uniref:PEHE domain-containing protein n=2 Tax=Xenopus laevis TaxID=8355 RepID=A0A974BWT9_XENLA|nr:KAT8 regulatory NSL complex subunit 1 isoform X2 [Xenopus laevis]OCT62246.1 hypothetical protein XELAEV_18043330mg [Xenopus laevis]
MAAMAPALTDPAPDAHNLHFKLAPPSSSLPLGQVNGGSLPPAPDLVSSYCGTIGKEQLKLAGVLGPCSILSQSILEINLEELRGITNSGRGGQEGPLNGLAKKLNAVPNLEPWVKTPAVSPESPAAAQEEKGTPVEPASGARLQALLRRHGEMEERARRLQKRLRLVQAKQVERHLHQQLGGLVGASVNRTLESPGSRLNVLTRKAEAQRRVEEEGAGSDAFMKEAAPELEKLSLSGGAALRACELGFDSDATESSSGGDSDIEEEELNRPDTLRNHVPLKRRCEWSWAQERADVVSRWNWLQAHVSDLEYRIRQHTDFYRQLRAGKGQVLLGEASPSETAGEPLRSSLSDSRTSSSPSADAERRAESGTPEAKSLQRPINGVVNMLPPVLPPRPGSDPQELTPSKPLSPLPDATCVCARARPLVGCKRRRIVRPDRLMPLNKKVQRVAPHVCEVSSSCVMCASLPAPSSQFQYSDPLAERLALLDPSVHPVLSFPHDIPASLRLLSLLRSHKQDRSKSIKKLKLRPLNQLQSTPEPPRGDRLQGTPNVHRVSHHRPADLPPKQHLEPPLRTLKIDRSLLSRPDPSVPTSAPHVKRRQLGVPDRNGAQQVDVSVSSPIAVNPVPPLIRQLSASSEGPISSYSASAVSRRRRTESSYDINNIVIPMSVAATTRVEKLQYKEILTPSWRVVHITPVTPNNEEDPEELEDLSDAAFSSLHAVCEEQERLRWQSSVPPQRRGSRTHRTSESSVTPSAGPRPLTPQPSSPDTGSWQALPDFSPLSPDVLSAPPTPTSRETSRLLSEETHSSVSDSGREEMAVQPWERRNFPLSYSPKRELAGPCEPTDWGGPRPPRRPSCSSRTAKDPDDPPSSPPCPVSRPRPLHR